MQPQCLERGFLIYCSTRRRPGGGEGRLAGAGPKRRGSPVAMRWLGLGALLAGLCVALAAEESCVDRCNKGFEAQKKCQCDDLCVYYQSCCSDYHTVCKPKVTRGDVFLLPEDDYLDYYDAPNTTISGTTENIPESETTAPTVYDYVEPEGPHTVPEGEGTDVAQLPGTDVPNTGPEVVEEEAEELCSGKPFDAFTSLKNGSIFAFRGKYLYELDEKSVRPGYPKLIQDVWGIEGPIDAAFTRINCEGKTYLFQGDKYWRFADGVLEDGFPRNISDGFKGIPDDLDAAFALPAQNYFSSERVYFFKGRKYWSYDFANQPTREDCEKTSPSLVFDHYTVLKYNSWEELLHTLWGSTRESGASRPHFISRDWHGIPGQVDAAMLGRIYVAQSSPRRRSWKKSPRRRHRKKYHRKQRWGLWNWQSDISSESSDLDWLFEGSTPCQPLQSVYFFSKDKYYRLNLRTRRVDVVNPRYPRNIAKYWLGCPSDEDLA